MNYHTISYYLLTFSFIAAEKMDEPPPPPAPHPHRGSNGVVLENGTLPQHADPRGVLQSPHYTPGELQLPLQGVVVVFAT